jgi:hypothetical protein
MEDRFALVQIPTPHMPEDPIVRLFCILDGHGGHVSIFRHFLKSFYNQIAPDHIFFFESFMSAGQVLCYHF